VKELKSEKDQRLIRELKAGKEEEVVYDPSKPLKLRFKVLQEYLKEYESKRKEDEKDINKGESSKSS